MPNRDHWRVGAIDPVQFEALSAAIDKGPNKVVLDYLARGGDPDLRGREFGSTLLHAAAFKGRTRLVEALVRAGADVDAVTGQSFTPLASAAHKGHIGCVRALLAAGASLACEPLGQTLVDSLQWAQVKSPEIKDLLLAVARPNEREQ
jgi:ankyrin repeat protein